ncbi:hypothetical protein RchiOBHm_Chr1g0341031 [Rosa chinensis]|uniref:Uncharacterized protein n=1 Tax=Rosa chinensis TaxID=74649 RepID=A0A2P6SDL9_ROSCH|nr:hypothetical protein RchiOBHm_Chr1g0341031 [Rosa chinensis]
MKEGLKFSGHILCFPATFDSNSGIKLVSLVEFYLAICLNLNLNLVEFRRN